MINETITGQKVRCSRSVSHCQRKRRIRIRHWTRDLPRIGEPPHIFLSFYLPDPLPFYFPASLFLSLSRFPPCVELPSFLCPPNRCSLHEIPQSILTLAVRGRLVRGCWTECRNGDEARGMMRKKKKKTLLDLASLYSLYTSVSVCLSVSWSPFFVHPVSRFPTMGNASSDADVSNITCALHFSSVSPVLLIWSLHLQYITISPNQSKIIFIGDIFTGIIR